MTDDARARFLQDRVLTATPGERIVMLFDRLSLDLTRATMAEPGAIRQHTSHASQIIAELYGSLDTTAGGPVNNLSAIYAHLLSELMVTDTARLVAKLASMLEIVTMLRSAWIAAVGQLDQPGRGAATSGAGKAPAVAGAPSLVGSWVG
jgi:flagellar protein FliS